jgi:hypothetical protein
MSCLLALTISISTQIVKAQTAKSVNIVNTAVPFLRINPDARAGGMGDLSLATSPDPSSTYFNLGKVPFNQLNAGGNISYTPWLKQLVNDVYMASAAGFYKLDEIQSISGSIRYFSLGNIQFTNHNGDQIGNQNPREFGLQAGYSRKLSDKIGFGVGVKYINSSLAQGTYSGSSYKAGNAVAADLGFYLNNQNGEGQGWAFGAALTNLGSKIGYTSNADQKDFIPATLGLGTTYTKVIDESNQVSIGVDVNKLLVPTPPNAQTATAADYETYRNKSVISSWGSSFSDAPGGFREELREFQVSGGAEYIYNNQFSLRAGYFWEDKTKGNRKYFSTGLGLKYNPFGLNFSYLVPVGSGINQNPLSNTLRFSLVFDLDQSIK